MQQSSRTPVQKIEDAHELTDALQTAGYTSVFDITRIPRAHFIKKHNAELHYQAGDIYDLALGYATQIGRAFREQRGHFPLSQGAMAVREGLQTRPGTGRALVTGGPDWQGLFGDSVGGESLNTAPESNDSPVSYLTYLYNQSLEFEETATPENIIKLADRRPDIPGLILDNDAINQVVPSLQLVNEILESAVKPYIATAAPSESVDQVLADTRYPTTLPYHYPHQQALLALKDGQSTLRTVLAQTDTTWPYFLSDTLKTDEMALALGSDLAPEQQVIITEKDNAADATPAEITAFYEKNLGGQLDFSSPAVFMQQLGLSMAETEALLAGTAADTTVVATENVKPTLTGASDKYGATFINEGNPLVMAPRGMQGSASDTGVNPKSSLRFQSVEKRPGFEGSGGGLSLTHAKNTYAWFDAESDAAQMMKGDKPFSLGCWLKIPAITSFRSRIFSNSGDVDLKPKDAAGFSLFTYNGTNLLDFTIMDSAGKASQMAWQKIYPLNQWFYLCLTWDNATKTGTVMFTVDGITVTTLVNNASTLGDITMADGFTWVFNANGDFSSAVSPDDDRTLSVYDDIGVFPHCLTEDDIKKIGLAGRPGSVESLSQSPAHFYDFIYGNFYVDVIANTSNARMDRVNRMVRLQRWLNLPYDEVDLLVTSAMRAEADNSTALSMNTNTLRMLGVFRHYQQRYGVTAPQFAAVLHQITPYALTPAVPFLDQVFNSPPLLNTPFVIDGQAFDYTQDADPKSSDTIHQICAGLGISETQFWVLADSVANAQGNLTAHTLPRSLDVVSAFYRLVMVPRWLGLSFAEGVALMTQTGSPTALSLLSGIPVISPLDTTTGQPKNSDILDVLMALADAADWHQTHQLSAVRTQLLALSDTVIPPATQADVNFISNINSPLQSALLNEVVFENSGVPSPALPTYWDGELLCSGPNALSDTPLTGLTGFSLDTTKKQFAYFDEAMSEMLNGSQSYTLGCWFKRAAGTTDDLILTGNAKISTTGASSDLGVFVLLNNEKVMFSVSDSNKGNAQNTTLSYIRDKWYYLSLTLDTVAKKVTGYLSTPDTNTVQSVVLDYTTFTGSIIPPEAQRWAFNEDGALSYYATTFTSRKGVISYSDITLWDKVLTQAEIETIVASGLPAGGRTDAVYNGPVRAPENVTWADILSDLVDMKGLVRPVENSLEIITAKVSEALTGLVFTGMSNDEAADILARIIYQAKTVQDGIADSALASALHVNPALPFWLLTWADETEYALLSQTLANKDLTDPNDIPADYLQMLYQQARRAGVVNTFGLTPAMLSTFLAHPTWFGLPDATINTLLLYRFSRYRDFLLQLSGSEDDALGYLSWVNSLATPASDVDAQKAAQQLAKLLAWDAGEVQLAAAHASPTDEVARSVDEIDTVMRLQALSQQIGASVIPLLATAALDTTSDYAAWQQVGGALMVARSQP